MRLLNLLERIAELPAEVWLLPPIIILGTMAAVSLLLRSARLRRFRAIAEHTGLTVHAKIMDASAVTGTFRGRSLTMTTANTRAATFRRRWTLVTVDVKNPELLRLHLSRQDFVDRLMVAAGLTDIQVGDETFDRKYLIQSDEPKVVRRVFQSDALRDALLRASVCEAAVGTPGLRVYYGREERDPSHAELLFTAAIELANAIDALKPDYTPEMTRPPQSSSDPAGTPRNPSLP